MEDITQSYTRPWQTLAWEGILNEGPGSIMQLLSSFKTLLGICRQKCKSLDPHPYHSMSLVGRCCLFLHLLVWPAWLHLYNSTQGSKDRLAEPSLLGNIRAIISI